MKDNAVKLDDGVFCPNPQCPSRPALSDLVAAAMEIFRSESKEDNDNNEDDDGEYEDDEYEDDEEDFDCNDDDDHDKCPRDPNTCDCAVNSGGAHLHSELLSYIATVEKLYKELTVAREATARLEVQVDAVKEIDMAVPIQHRPALNIMRHTKMTLRLGDDE
jgi:hypothetical protein